MMGVEMRAALARRHVIVTEEQQAIAAGVLDHNLRVACIAHALLNAQSGSPVPVAAPMPVSALPVAQHARPSDMRARLGLG